MKNQLIFIPILFLFYACSPTQKKTVTNSKIIKWDTIYSPYKKGKFLKCEQQIKGFKNRLGLSLSNFYVIDQKIYNDKDSIAIVKPFYVESSDNSDCIPETIGKNLLLVYNIKNKTTGIYENLLFSDDRNVFQELKTNNNSFVINAEQGNSSKLFSSIYISKNKVDSLKIESWGFKQYSKTYYFKNYDLKKFKFKIIDSLQQKLDSL